MQNHASVLRDPELVTASVALGLFDLPAVATGQSAAVFRLNAKRSWAVRCMTQDGVGREKAYLELRDRLVDSECPYFVESEWQTDGISVNGDDWPIVKMEWIEGITLEKWVAENRRQHDELRRMSDRIEVLLEGVWALGIAHGDLQHGNIIVRAGGDLSLVDYDGVIVFDPGSPGTWEGLGGDVVGHPNYQHPHRVESNLCSPWMDTFAGLLITTSIRSVASCPDLWDRFHNEENLIFSAADLQRPGDTPIWADVRSIESVREHVELLEQFCRRDSDLRATYSQLVQREVPIGGGSWRAQTSVATNGHDLAAVNLWGNGEATESDHSFGSTGAPSTSVIISTDNNPGRESRGVLIWAICVVLIAALVALAMVAFVGGRQGAVPGAPRVESNQRQAPVIIDASTSCRTGCLEHV